MKEDVKARRIIEIQTILDSRFIPELTSSGGITQKSTIDKQKVVQLTQELQYLTEDDEDEAA
jgi:hypothetical protein